MTSRERFVKILNFELVGEVTFPCMFYAIHHEAVRRWQREGVPRDVHIISHLGLERIELIPVNIAPLPHYERGRLEEVEEWRLGIDREFRAQISEEIATVEEQPPIREPSDWNWFQKLLNPQSPARYPRFWDDYKRCVAGRDYPLGIYLGSLLSWLIEWLGVKGVVSALNENRAWLDSIVEHITDFVIETTTRAITEVDVDFALFTEGCAYRVLSAIDTESLIEWLRPAYERITSWVHSHGVNLLIMQAGGDVKPLIPMWLDVGINALAPLTVTAGMEPLRLRECYGQNLALIGGIDCNALATSKREITDEVMRKVPQLLEQGGFIPAPDGLVQANVPWSNFEYYIHILRSMHGS